MVSKVVRFCLQVWGKPIGWIADTIAKLSKPEHFPVTSGFAIICLLVFLLPLPDTLTAFSLGNLLHNLGDWHAWASLPISVVSHASLSHIVMNMVIFLLCMPRVERKIGATYSMYLLVIGGIASTLLMALDNNMNNYGLGASGAIFSVIGCFCVLEKNRLMSWLLVGFVGIMVLQNYVDRWASGDSIGFMAHVSGFIVGVIYILWLMAFKRESLPMFQAAKLTHPVKI
jgi:membrane associated rhomboid family serine protease